MVMMGTITRLCKETINCSMRFVPLHDHVQFITLIEYQLEIRPTVYHFMAVDEKGIDCACTAHFRPQVLIKLSVPNARRTPPAKDAMTEIQNRKITFKTQAAALKTHAHVVNPFITSDHMLAWVEDGLSENGNRPVSENSLASTPPANSRCQMQITNQPAKKNDQAPHNW